MKTTTLTPESFEKLLAWLDSNREEAAVKYESVRRRLIKYYTCNGCADQAEDLGDEAFNRVATKLERGQIPEPFTGNKALFFLAFAKNIRRESLQKPTEIPDPQPVTSDTAEAESQCLEECARILPVEERWLAIEYYNCEKSTKVDNHKKLAKQVRLGLAGLRTRMHRIREALRPCMEECLERLSG